MYNPIMFLLPIVALKDPLFKQEMVVYITDGPLGNFWAGDLLHRKHIPVYAAICFLRWVRHAISTDSIPYMA